MALPSSGAISLSQVNTELGLASTTAISLNQSNVRTLFGVASGAISMSNGYGKSNWLYAAAGATGYLYSTPGGVFVGQYYGYQTSFGSKTVTNTVLGTTLSTGCSYFLPQPGYGTAGYSTRWTAAINLFSLKFVNTSTGATIEGASNQAGYGGSVTHALFTGTNIWPTTGQGWALYIK